MKQLFFGLLLIAIASSGYLKAIQSQDDAAREVAQVLKEEPKTKGAPTLAQSFERVAAAQAVAQPTLAHSTVVVVTTLPAPAVHDDQREIEVQLGELIQREPEIDKLFEGKGSLAYIAIRNLILVSKYPGYVRSESLLINQSNEVMEARIPETYKALADLSQSMTPEQQREYQVYIEEMLSSYELRNRTMQEDPRNQPPQSNGEQP